MPRRSSPLRIVRIVVAALLGAAALLCAGLWIAQALSPPRPTGGRHVPSEIRVLRLSTSRHALTAWVADGRLELVCGTRVCWVCLRTEPDHAPTCTKGQASALRVVAPPPWRQHSINLPGLRYSDCWAAPIGLLSANLYISLWLLIALLAPYPLFVLARAWRRRRLRLRPGVCVACGYDLTGNVSGVCPECGHEVRGGPSSSQGLPFVLPASNAEGVSSASPGLPRSGYPGSNARQP